MLGWGLWGHSQHPTQSGCRQGCCLLFPATELRARGGERTTSSYLAAHGPQLSDAAWRSSSLTWKGQRGGGCLAGRWCSLATSCAASQSTRGSPVPWQCSIPGYPGVIPYRRQEESLSPADCGDLGLLIPPLGALASKGTWGLPHVQAPRPSLAVLLFRTEGNVVLAELMAPGHTAGVRPRGSQAFLGLRALSGCPLSAALCR